MLELLISVAIFSGMIILALGAFARSAASQAKTNELRNKVQASRTVIDQISNDLHYIDTVDTVTSLAGCYSGSAPTFLGARLGVTAGCDELELLLNYPGTAGTSGLVWKRYVADTINSRPSLYVYEQRGCSVLNGVINCPNGTAANYDTLPTQYVLDGLDGLTTVFGGLDPASAKLTTTTPDITVHFDVKSASLAAISCTSLPAGSCYTLDTTIIPGGLNR